MTKRLKGLSIGFAVVTVVFLTVFVILQSSKSAQVQRYIDLGIKAGAFEALKEDTAGSSVIEIYQGRRPTEDAYEAVIRKFEGIFGYEGKVMSRGTTSSDPDMPIDAWNETRQFTSPQDSSSPSLLVRVLFIENDTETTGLENQLTILVMRKTD